MIGLRSVGRSLVPLLAFVPFALMLAVHWYLGLSDALMVNPAPGERFWPMYNPIMVLMFYLGCAGFLWLTVWGWPALRTRVTGLGPRLIIFNMARTIAWVAVLTFSSMAFILIWVAYFALT